MRNIFSPPFPLRCPNALHHNKKQTMNQTWYMRSHEKEKLLLPNNGIWIWIKRETKERAIDGWTCCTIILFPPIFDDKSYEMLIGLTIRRGGSDGDKKNFMNIFCGFVFYSGSLGLATSPFNVLSLLQFSTHFFSIDSSSYTYDLFFFVTKTFLLCLFLVCQRAQHLIVFLLHILKWCVGERRREKKVWLSVGFGKDKQLDEVKATPSANQSREDTKIECFICTASVARP